MAELSDRQVEILELIAAGKTDAKVGELLDISAETVATHVQRAARAAGVKSRSALVDWGWRNNVIGDRADLLAAIEALKAEHAEEVEKLMNTADNLRIMYATAVGFKGFES